MPVRAENADAASTFGCIELAAKSKLASGRGDARRTARACGTVHRHRHAFACSWVEKGEALAALQQTLGHASIVTTQRYARLTDEAVQRKFERLHREQAGNAAS